MSTNPQKNTNDEEVDLGTLFQIIGRGFSKLFQFFGNIFKGLFHILIVLLIFVKTYIVKIGVSLLIGLVVGYFLEANKTPTFRSEMLVQPNFKSARQLYNNIAFYNDLVKQEEVETLQQLFSLDQERASSLKTFEIEPIISENDIIEAFDKLVTTIDTATVKSYDYELFKGAFTDYDYRIHKIEVVAEKNDVFPNIGKQIVASLANNQYFKKVKSIYNENTRSTDSLYKQNLSQIDSLRKVYMRALLEEAKKETSGTNISLDGEQRRAKELELFDVNRRVSEELKELVKERSEEFEVVNVISNFQEKGYKIKSITSNYMFLFGAGFTAIMILFLLLIKLNHYLDNYQKQ